MSELYTDCGITDDARGELLKVSDNDLETVFKEYSGR